MQVHLNPENAMRDGFTDNPAKPPSSWGPLFIGLVLGAALSGAAWYVTQVNPSLLKPQATPEQNLTAESEETPVEILHQGLPLTPFEKGFLPADEAIESIKITLGVGTEGTELNEPVDVHLGLGFPLRLFPLGGEKREPSFAAFSHRSSLAGGSQTIQPGQMATFEFSTNETDIGQDNLRTTKQLLSEVKCGDLQRIGFASQGRSDWVLAGYRIEVNGKLFAANGLVNARAQDQLAIHREDLLKILPEYEARSKQATLTEAEQAAFKDQHLRVRELSGRITGAVPWFEETSPNLQPTALTGTPIQALRVTLTTSSGAQSGTRNPLYLQAGSQKFLLTSESDALSDDPTPQIFDLAGFELALNPLTRESLALPGLGLLGSGALTNKVPDRAQLQRVVIEAEGQIIYDSQLNPDDLKTLPALWLTPVAHFDETGAVVNTTLSETEVPLWKSGMKLKAAPITPLPEMPPPIVGPAVQLPPPPLLPPLRRVYIGGYPPPGSGVLGLLDVIAHLLLPLPPPAAPLISGVRISPVTAIVCDGDPVMVNWTVGGDTSQIASWRVDLFAVLPHKAVPVLITPLTTKVAVPPGATSVVMPPIVRANVAALLTGAESLYLHVQPRVTAIGPLGHVITAANGSLLPLFPTGTTTASVGLRRGGIRPPISPGNAPAPSFQITPPLPALPLPWAGLPLADPLAIRNAWSLTTEHGSHFGLLFASHENIPGAITLPAWSTAARPTGDDAETLTIRFEGLVPMSAAAHGFRAIAHVGFVGGSAPATTGKIQARAELSSGPIRRNLAGAVMPFPFGAQPFFTLQTAISPLPLSKATPLTLIDIPLRFDRMAANNFVAYPLDPVNAAAYLPPSPPAPPWNAADFSFNPVAYNAQAVLGTMYVTVTFKITMNTADATDAVGVIGLRLVPDNTP